MEKIRQFVAPYRECFFLLVNQYYKNEFYFLFHKTLHSRFRKWNFLGGHLGSSTNLDLSDNIHYIKINIIKFFFIKLQPSYIFEKTAYAIWPANEIYYHEYALKTL